MHQSTSLVNVNLSASSYNKAHLPFTPLRESAAIDQSSEIGTPIITVTATDDDEPGTPNSDIIFSLNDTALPFFIDPSSGVISTQSTPDVRSYSVVVIASDNGLAPLTATGTITIEVALPNTNTPQIPADLTFMIVENAPPTAETAVFEFFASDPDPGPEGRVRLELLPSLYSDDFTLENADISDDRTVVRIYHSSGPGFDREAVTNFTLSMEAMDLGDQSFRKTAVVTLLVTITDVNDSPPMFVGAPYTTTVSENATRGTSIARVEAADEDEGTNADISYFFFDFEGDEFTIDEESGDVFVSTDDLLVAERPSYRIPVRAFDGAFNATTYINIILLEVNDNPPQFVPTPPSVAMLSEDTEVGNILFNVSTTDEDTGRSGEVVLSIEQVGETFGHGMYQDNEFYIFLNEPIDFEVSCNFTTLCTCLIL